MPKNHFKTNLFFVQMKHLKSTFPFGKNWKSRLSKKNLNFKFWTFWVDRIELKLMQSLETLWLWLVVVDYQSQLQLFCTNGCIHAVGIICWELEGFMNPPLVVRERGKIAFQVLPESNCQLTWCTAVKNICQWHQQFTQLLNNWFFLISNFTLEKNVSDSSNQKY